MKRCSHCGLAPLKPASPLVCAYVDAALKEAHHRYLRERYLEPYEAALKAWSCRPAGDTSPRPEPPVLPDEEWGG